MQAVLEGLLYIQGDIGLTLQQVMDIFEIDEDEAKNLVLNLKNYYEQENRGLRINYLGNTFKLTTKSEHRNYYQKLIENPKTHLLSSQALETLAIIAYNEPITRNQIDEIRGVDSSYVIRRILAKGLIKECGRDDSAGRPILYKTTDEFLDYFGLATKDDLPKIDSLEEEDTSKTLNDLYQSKYSESN